MFHYRQKAKSFYDEIACPYSETQTNPRFFHRKHRFSLSQILPYRQVTVLHSRTSIPFQAAIVIAAAAAFAASLQPVAQAPAPPVAGTLPVPALGAPVVPASGPAPNTQFAADMAAIKARLLSYLTAPGVVTKVQ